MANEITSPNMGIVVPVNLQDPSPTWGATLQNSLYVTIDGHNHSSGNGVQVPTSGLNLNADLTFNGYNATNLRAARFQNQTSPLSLGTDVCEFYVCSGDGYFNDVNGNAIRLTINGAPNATFGHWSTKSVSGNFTILATDTTQLYFVDVSGGVATGNLPPSSQKTPGSILQFEDVKTNSETNAITIVPNGTDKINGSNSNYVWQQNGGKLTLETDGAGNWFAHTAGFLYLKSTGISFTGDLAISGTTGINFQYNGTNTANIGSAALNLNSGTVLNFAGSDGYVQLAGTKYINLDSLSGTVSFPQGINNGTALGSSSGPTISSGTGAPSSSSPNGSVYFRIDGSATTAIYTRQSSAWVAISSGWIAPVTTTIRTITTTYTVDSSGSDMEIWCNHSAAFTLTLPAPSTGRIIIVKDISGAAETNNITLAQHASEKIEGVAGSRVLQTNFGSWTIVSDGTNWFFNS